MLSNPSESITLKEKIIYPKEWLSKIELQAITWYKWSDSLRLVKVHWWPIPTVPLHTNSFSAGQDSCEKYIIQSNRLQSEGRLTRACDIAQSIRWWCGWGCCRGRPRLWGESHFYKHKLAQRMYILPSGVIVKRAIPDYHCPNLLYPASVKHLKIQLLVGASTSDTLSNT